jgi:putative ABC transport system permease protein
MIRNYFKTAWRNLARNKGFAFTNLLGLTIGISCTMLILLWVQDELSWNKFQRNYSTTYKVYANRNFNGEISTDESIAIPLAKGLEQNYAGIKNAAFTSFQEEHILAIGDKKMRRSGYRVSEHFFNIFSWNFIRGNAAEAISNPNAVVLTETTARALFGDEDPVNKVIRLDNTFDIKVSAVVADVPHASSLRFDFITPFNADAASMNDWVNSYTNLYVQTDEKISEATLGKNITDLVRKNSEDRITVYFAHPMSKWRLYSDFSGGKNTGGMIEYVRLFSVIALVILVIACVNFMNLSTARSEKRAKEVGIRKTLGSGRKELMLQFFFESIILASVAFMLSVLLIYLVLPAFNTLVDKQLTLKIDDPLFASAALSIIIFTGLLAGSYPAIYLSSFNPVKVLKGSFLPGKAALMPRKLLVIGQFVISILLITSTIVVYQQIQYVKNRDLGYRPDNLIQMRSSPETDKNFTAILQELKRTGMVESATRTSAPMTDIYNYTPAPDYEGKPEGNMIVTALRASENFTSTMGIKMSEGRDFTGVPADSSSMLLNKAAVKLMGLKNPVGMQMRYGGNNYTVIGVTDDVVMVSPYNPVDPMIMFYRAPGRRSQFINIRLSKNAAPKQAIAALQTIFEKYNPAYPFEYQFVDQEFNRKFITEELIGKLTNLFAGLAIFICCLGMAGLASFTIEKRFREIGVRKVLGATVQQLLILISRDFLKLTAIAFVIAVPVTWWLMSNWLENYTYRVSMNIWVFAIVGFLVLLITLAIVCLYTAKAALTNPTRSLRAD